MPGGPLRRLFGARPSLPAALALALLMVLTVSSVALGNYRYY